MAKLNLGAVTAYADAVKAGFAGTREEFAEWLANAGKNAEAVAENLEESKRVLADVNTAGAEQIRAVGDAAEEKKTEIAGLDAVQFDVPQSDKTPAQKKQARMNIDAAAQEDVDSLSEAIAGTTEPHNEIGYATKDAVNTLNNVVVAYKDNFTVSVRINNAEATAYSGMFNVLNGANQVTASATKVFDKNVSAGIYVAYYETSSDKVHLYYTLNSHSNGVEVESGVPFELTASGCIYIRVDNGLTGECELTFRIYSGDSKKTSAIDLFARDNIQRFAGKILPVVNSVYSLCGLREIAHQGYNNNAPSNSIRAFEDACKMGAWGVNTAQVRRSADGTLWIMHDPTVDTTTNGTGNMGELTDEYLSTLRIYGAGSDDDRRIPTLEDVLKLCNRYGTIPMIRISTAGSGKFSYNKYDTAYESMFNLVRKYNLADRVMFSGEYSALKVIDEYFPKALKVDYWSSSTAIETMVNAYNKHAWFSKSTVIAMVNASRITDETAHIAFDNGYGLYATDATETDLPRLAELGVGFYNSKSYIDNFADGVVPTIQKLVYKLNQQ